MTCTGPHCMASKLVVDCAVQAIGANSGAGTFEEAPQHSSA